MLLVVAAPAAANTDCSPAGIEAARKQFRNYYDTRDYTRARDTLRPFELDCFGENPQGMLAASTLSDLAIAAHHTGDDDVCIEALEPYPPALSGSERRLSGLPGKLKKAIRFNLGLCSAGCNIVDAASQPIRAALALQKLVEGGTAATACPFRAGKHSVAVPGMGGIACATSATATRRRGCESGHGQSAGRMSPPGSRAERRRRDHEICCVRPILTVTPEGRFVVVPEENPPEGCLTGHRTYVVQEIYALDHGKLKLIHKVREGVTCSRRVVKNDPQSETPARADPTDAVAHRYPIGAAGAFDRPVMDREDDGLGLP